MVTVKDLYEKVRSYDRDEDDQGAYSNDILRNHFDMAWRRTHETLARNQIPCVTGWIARYLPAYADRIRLYSYGSLYSIDVMEEKRVLASAAIKQVVWDERGTIITTDALTTLLDAGLVTGNQVTLVGLPGSMGLEGEFTVVIDPVAQDTSLLIPGLETRGIPATFPAGARVVYAQDTYAQVTASDGSAVHTRNANLNTGFVLSASPYSWSVQSGTVTIPMTTWDRLIRMRGSFGVDSPEGLDDEVPAQLISVLVPATMGYATLGVNRQRGMEMLRDAFGSIEETGVLGGALGAFVDNQMKAAQVANVTKRNIDNVYTPWLSV